MRVGALLSIGLAAVAGCGGSPSAPGGTAAGGATRDAGGAGGAGGGAASCPPATPPLGTDPAAGESFPDLSLTDCGGSEVNLRELRCSAAVTLLSISAGWCEPCRQEAPQLEAAYQQLGGPELLIVEVLFQDGQALPATTQFCQSWTDELGLSMPVLIDPVQNTVALFDVAHTPLHAIVDRSGRVLFSQTGKLDDVVGTLAPWLP